MTTENATTNYEVLVNADLDLMIDIIKDRVSYLGTFQFKTQKVKDLAEDYFADKDCESCTEWSNAFDEVMEEFKDLKDCVSNLSDIIQKHRA